ncbi:MAG: PhzF family phenazine biosynthesis protein [Pseudomonadota bacterium]
MDIQRISAFTNNNTGGNPAGVCLVDHMLGAAQMREIAAQVGYSETAFCAPQDGLGNSWRVRYFAPDAEVPFCGHATIALGAALGAAHGPGIYALVLNDANITLDTSQTNGVWRTTLQSPKTHSEPLPDDWLVHLCHHFGLQSQDLHPEIPPALIFGGARHVLIPLKSRLRLSQLGYNFTAMRDFQTRNSIVTLDFVMPETPTIFHARNMFAFGGVYEDPATGAAAAAFCGYLRDIAWPHGGAITLYQGEDMGRPSKIMAQFAQTGPIAITGETVWL